MATGTRVRIDHFRFRVPDSNTLDNYEYLAARGLYPHGFDFNDNAQLDAMMELCWRVKRWKVRVALEIFDGAAWSELHWKEPGTADPGTPPTGADDIYLDAPALATERDMITDPGAINLMVEEIYSGGAGTLRISFASGWAAQLSEDPVFITGANAVHTGNRIVRPSLAFFAKRNTDYGLSSILGTDGLPYFSTASTIAMNFCGITATLAARSDSGNLRGSIIVTPNQWWQYADSNGVPVWDVGTGALLLPRVPNTMERLPTTLP